MNYANIKYYDIANGPGVRTSVFVSGCRHHCPGCFNAVAWDFDYGQPFDKTVRNEVFASCQPDYIAGLSLLGGEPFEPENQRELLPFVRNFKALYPAKTVWCYSGYTWEQLTGKEPSPVAKGMSWMKTNVKLALEESDETVADLITEGCNMGVKSLNRYLNQYEAAEEQAKDIAKRLIHLESGLAQEMQPYL